MAALEGRFYCWRVSPSGYPCEGFDAPDEWPLIFEPHELLRSLIAESKMKRTERKVTGGENAVASDKEFAKKAPLLSEMMTVSKWDDGTPRQVSTLLVFVQDGVFKAMLKDKDAGLCLWVANPSFFGVLGALEGALGDDQTEWRQDRPPGGSGAAKRVQKGRG